MDGSVLPVRVIAEIMLGALVVMVPGSTVVCTSTARAQTCIRQSNRSEPIFGNVTYATTLPSRREIIRVRPQPLCHAVVPDAHHEHGAGRERVVHAMSPPLTSNDFMFLDLVFEE